MTSPPERPRVGFILERSLGHTTHAATLSRLLPEQSAVEATIAQIDFGVSGFPARIPVYNSNWTVRAGVRARRIVRGWSRSGDLDGLFVHTQVPAVLLRDRLRRIPTVVSLDATPLQYDELGAAYQHPVGHHRVEHLKWRANQVCFERAVHVVAWSGWAKQGVVDGYGISPAKITVIPPGVTPALWRRAGPAPDARGADRPLRILFVGGDLERKGGLDLVQAVRRLRQQGQDGTAGIEVVLDVVTRAQSWPRNRACSSITVSNRTARR